MEKKEAIQWTGDNFDAVMNFAGESGGHKVAYEDAQEFANQTGRMYISSVSKWLDKGDILQKFNGGLIVIKGFCGPTEDKKAPVEEDLEKVIENIIVNWLKSDNENATYCAHLITFALKYSRIHERNKAIDECIKAVIKTSCVAPDKCITRFEIVLIELGEKLKDNHLEPEQRWPS